MARTAVNTASYVGLGSFVQTQIDAKVKTALENKLRVALPQVICARLQEQGFDAEAYLRTAEDQTSFFFDLIESVNAPGSIPPDTAGQLGR